ncbi:MAG TPA: LuxR C-terminal-related transcriptional regulator [Bacillales bacterium]|nr:LuxR C-terminal-related transcriptional regulator [Bacillales bacterium]
MKHQSFQEEQSQLKIPAQNQSILIRPHCYDLIDHQSDYSLISVIAPVGYGKTTFLADLAHTLMTQHAVGWITLDDRGNDPAVFLKSLILACPHIGPSQKELFIRKTENPGTEPLAIMEELLEFLSSSTKPWHLFLDQYDLITNDTVHQLLGHFLKNSGNPFTLYLASRTRPPFLNKIRNMRPSPLTITTQQMKFDTKEIQSYIEQKASLHLEAAELKQIEEKTEGWPLAIHRYALLLNHHRNHDRPDIQKTLNALQQEMDDFLIDQLFSTCPPDLQEMLLAVSVPEFFNAELANSLIENGEVKHLYDRIQTQGILASRDSQGYFRLHPIFRSTLQSHLKQVDGEKFHEIHKKCSNWFERTHDIFRAIIHATTIEEYDLAVKILLDHILSIFQYPLQQKTQLVESIPYDVVVKEPAAAMVFAWFLISMNRLSTAEKLINQTETYLYPGNQYFPPTGESIPGYIATMRSRIAFLRRDKENGIKYMAEASTLLDNGSYLYSHSNTLNQYGSSLLKSVVGHWGAIDQCIAMCKEVEGVWNGVNQGFGIMTILLGECYFERNERAKAEKYLTEGRRIGLDLQDMGLLLPASIALIQLRKCMKQDYAADILMDETLKIVENGHPESLETFKAFQARMAIKEQHTETVEKWVKAYTLTADQLLDPQYIFDYVTLLKAYHFLGQTKEGIMFGEKLLQLSETWYMPYFIAEVHLFLCSFYQKNEEDAACLYHVEKALEIGEKEGYRQLFLMEWDIMDSIMPKLKRKFRYQTLATGIIHFFNGLVKGHLETEMTTDPLLLAKEKLSNQEYKVLKLLMKGQSNRDIAEQLYVSIETVKSHCKNIYKKLNLKGRKEVLMKFNGH